MRQYQLQLVEKHKYLETNFQNSKRQLEEMQKNQIKKEIEIKKQLFGDKWYHSIRPENGLLGISLSKILLGNSRRDTLKTIASLDLTRNAEEEEINGTLDNESRENL